MLGEFDYEKYKINNKKSIKVNKLKKNSLKKNNANWLLKKFKWNNILSSEESTNLSYKKFDNLHNECYFSNFFYILHKNIRFSILYFLIEDIKKLMLVCKTWKKEILFLLKLNTVFINNNFIQYSLKNSMKFINSYFVIINTRSGIRIDKLIKIKINSNLINYNIKFGYKYKTKRKRINIFKNNNYYYSNFEFNYLEKNKCSKKILFIEHLNDEKNYINFNLEKPEIIYSNDYILFPITIYSREGFIKNKSLIFQNIKTKQLNFTFKNYFFNEPFFQEKKIDEKLITMSWNYSINDYRNKLIPLEKLKKNFKLKEICSLGNEVIIVKGLFKCFKEGKINLSDKNNDSSINIRIIEKNDSFEYVIKNIDNTNDIYDVINLKIDDELLIIVKKFLN